LSDTVLELRDVLKNFGGLRPLRIRMLSIAPGERVAIGGVDAGAAEILVNLVTGATLPDEGSVTTFGKMSGEISSGDEWLASLDAFGILSPRAVMLDAATVQQNLAMPFTLEIDPVPAVIATKVEALATECGIATDALPRRAGEQDATIRARVHLARAVALDPKLLVLEHPTAGIADADKIGLARTAAAVAQTRHLAMLAITQDLEFAEAVAHRALTLEPATGALVPWKKKRGWFR
jgi:ABC-type transporter Mla maintaining outer membrane lipid asymmetry ATPase subunit MlaF